jgi:hypothetical protein
MGSRFGREPGDNTSFHIAQGLMGASGSRRRKKSKCVGSSQADPNFILGDDLTMSGVAAMEDKSIVGKVYG